MYDESKPTFSKDEIDFSINLKDNIKPMINNENLGPEISETINKLITKIDTFIPFAREYNAYKKAQENRPLLSQQDEYEENAENQLVNMKKELNDLIDILNIQVTAKLYADYLEATGDTKIQYNGQEMLESILEYRAAEVGYLKAKEEKDKALDTLNWIGITDEEKSNANLTIERFNTIEERYKKKKSNKKIAMYTTNGDRLTLTLLVNVSNKGINESVEFLGKDVEGHAGSYTENQILRYIAHKEYLLNEKSKSIC